MRTDDIFEALTDIDDRFIESARPLEQYDDSQPMIIKPAPKRPLWKTVVPAAACAAVVVAGGVIGVKYLRGHNWNTSVSEGTPAAFKEYWYPDEAKYIVREDIEYLGFGYVLKPNTGLSMYDAYANYAESYDKLAAKSDLIVSGTFIDAIHQTSDSEEIFCDGDKLIMSYNWLEVDSVIKGEINAGDVLTIGQNSTINSANGNDDKYSVFTCDQLSPMFKGDKWIYFLKREENGTFSPVNGPQGRYPLPNHTNRFVTWDGTANKLDKFSTYENIAPARDEIYERVLREFGFDSADYPKIKQIGVMDDANTFAMPEFPDYDFKASRAMVWADYFGEYGDIMDVFVFKAPDGGRLENLILADLNNDGKRELCATISENGVCSAVVRDFENGVTYTMAGSKTQEYILEIRDNALYVNTKKYESIDLITTTPSLLRLEMMITDKPDKQFTEITLDTDRTFALPDFEGFEFNVDMIDDHTQFRFNWRKGSLGSANPVNNVYLCDLDGDGKREIILNCRFVGDGCIRVYGFMDNGELGEALYFENGGCQLAESDGKLNYKANNSGERPFDFSRSDLKPMFAQSYSCEILDWGHTLDFSDVLSPELAEYNITISDRTLKIDYNGELTFDSGHKLSELYTMPDKENNSLVFVFTYEEDGTVGALKISEEPAKLYHFEENIALKPANDALYIVHEDGTEEPFGFPDEKAQIIAKKDLG